MILSRLVLLVQALLGLSVMAYLTYASLAVWAARLWRKTRRPLNPHWTPPVTILKPVRGVDAEAYENFASFCRLDYPADRLQILFGALDPEDPALKLVARLQVEFPHIAIGMVHADTCSDGNNFKVRNLRAMLPRARHELLVLSDSDMRVQPDYLRRVVAPFEPQDAQNFAARPGQDCHHQVGLVTCPYRGFQPRSLAAMLEAIGIGADFIPSALVSRALEGVGFAFGSTIALPRRVLEKLGGFEALADELADDFRLGEGARKAGYTVVLSDYVVDDVLGAERFGNMWARRLRWGRTIRACRPVGYAGAFITHGLALGLLFLAATGFSDLGWTALAAVTATRFGTSLWIAETCTRDPNIRRFLPLLPFSDLLSFALYIASFCGNHLTWRGERFRLLPGGKLARE
jgi:ceramide glucosyltransferase